MDYSTYSDDELRSFLLTDPNNIGARGEVVRRFTDGGLTEVQELQDKISDLEWELSNAAAEIQDLKDQVSESEGLAQE